jgi:molybdopterin synthase catalytic subunit
METKLMLTTELLEEKALSLNPRSSGTAGAVVQFLGIVRGLEDGQAIGALEYECFRPMAEHQFELLFEQMAQRWPLESVRLVHRLGVVQVNEASLFVEVVAPHREEAFTACEWLIDEMKKRVPIWRKPLPATTQQGKA